jgi:multidrug resistance efflux pump
MSVPKNIRLPRRVLVFSAKTLVATVMLANLPLTAGSVWAVSCQDEINRYENALDDLSRRNALAHQSLRAQMHRQPTMKSVAEADLLATIDEQHGRAALERARLAEAEGDSEGCLAALSSARRHPHEKQLMREPSTQR